MCVCVCVCVNVKVRYVCIKGSYLWKRTVCVNTCVCVKVSCLHKWVVCVYSHTCVCESVCVSVSVWASEWVSVWKWAEHHPAEIPLCFWLDAMWAAASSSCCNDSSHNGLDSGSVDWNKPFLPWVAVVRVLSQQQEKETGAAFFKKKTRGRQGS